MVEGGRIDHANHYALATRALRNALNTNTHSASYHFPIFSLLVSILYINVAMLRVVQ